MRAASMVNERAKLIIVMPPQPLTGSRASFLALRKEQGSRGTKRSNADQQRFSRVDDAGEDQNRGLRRSQRSYEDEHCRQNFDRRHRLHSHWAEVSPPRDGWTRSRNAACASALGSNCQR